MNIDKTKEKLVENFFTGLTFIVVGIVLLLNTTGNIPWSIWIKIFSFWPIFLIGFGIEMVCQFNRSVMVVGKSINFILFIGIIFLAASAVDARVLKGVGFSNEVRNFLKTNQNNGERKTQNDIVKSSEYELINTLNAKVNIGRGDVNINFNESGNIFALNSYFYEKYGSPKISKNVKDNNLSVTVDTDAKFDVKHILNSPSDLKYDIEFNNLNIKKDIDINVGAGDINLTKSYLSQIVLDLALQKEITLKDQKISLNTGAGNINLHLDKRIGYKIEYSVGLGEFSVDGNKFDKKIYTSENYDKAFEKVTFILDSGVGDIKIFNK